MLYYLERSYPYVGAGIITVILICFFKIDPVNSSNINEIIDGIVTLDSIIIGFIGAIIPVILSMKNESKLVRYVFDRDSDNLFRKYLSVTIGAGLLDVSISLMVYMRDIIANKLGQQILRALFMYCFILFLLCTYRSMTCMLKLIFSDDKKIENGVSKKLESNKQKALWDKRGK